MPTISNHSSSSVDVVVERRRTLSLTLYGSGTTSTTNNTIASYSSAQAQAQHIVQTIRVTLSTPPIDPEQFLPTISNPSPQSTSSSSHAQPGPGQSPSPLQLLLQPTLHPSCVSNDRNSLSPPSLRPTRHSLPQLAIPAPSLSGNINNGSANSQGQQQEYSRQDPRDLIPNPNPNPSHKPNFNSNHNRSESQEATTPETPASLSSPIVGVVDLTKYVKTTSKEPDCHGGYSDIYCGEWEKDVSEETLAKISDVDAGAVKCGKTGERRTETVKVAIKLLRVLSSNGYDEVKARKRLNREVYIWHRLEHPNIVTFLGTSYHMSGRPALVLPWFSNGCAPEYLRRKPHVDRLQLILDVARGLHYLHTMKSPIVHGDLKGNNILITDDGRATLSDFGLAQVIEEICLPQYPEYTPSGGVGPIRWQAPELLQDDIGHPKMPGDIWSFGCTCYELLTGNIPYHFRARDPLVMQDIQSGIRPPGFEENQKRCGDEGIWDLMNDCWITNPEERIQITDVVSRLEAICAG